MINYPAIFRALLMGVAALFFAAVVATGVHEASQQRKEQIARMAENFNELCGRREILRPALPVAEVFQF